MNKKPCIFNNFVLENFPYIEQDFDSLTNYQLFSKIVGYVQDIKKIVDEHSVFINEFEEEYQQLLTEFNQLKEDFEEFKISIQEEINSRFASLKTELVSLINNEINSLDIKINDSYIDSWNTNYNSKVHGLSTSFITQSNLGSAPVIGQGVLYAFTNVKY